LTNQVLILQSQKHKLEHEKNKVEAKVALLIAQPSFPNVGQLNELLVKSLHTEFSKILSAHDFSSYKPTELKELLTKFNELAEDVKGLKNQVYELEIELPGDLKEIPTKLEDLQRLAQHLFKLNLDALPSLLQKVTKALNSNSDDENTSHVAGSLAESSKKKKLRKFDFVTEGGDHVHLTKEQINAQKKIEEEAKAEAAKQEGEVRREELVDLFGLEVLSKYYNAKLQYDKYCDKMLNKRAKSRITNYDVLTRKGPITLKVYKEDDTSKIIPDFKASDLYLGE
ncbi:hypothetical protein Tco_1567026, partial [Tanacetum coccineum]